MKYRVAVVRMLTRRSLKTVVVPGKMTREVAGGGAYTVRVDHNKQSREEASRTGPRTALITSISNWLKVCLQKITKCYIFFYKNIFMLKIILNIEF